MPKPSQSPRLQMPNLAHVHSTHVKKDAAGGVWEASDEGFRVPNMQEQSMWIHNPGLVAGFQVGRNQCTDKSSTFSGSPKRVAIRAQI